MLEIWTGPIWNYQNCIAPTFSADVGAFVGVDFGDGDGARAGVGVVVDAVIGAMSVMALLLMFIWWF